MKLQKNKREFFTLGNLHAKRDWGSAKDYVESMWLMLKQKNLRITLLQQEKVIRLNNSLKKLLNMLTLKLSGEEMA